MVFKELLNTKRGNCFHNEDKTIIIQSVHHSLRSLKALDNIQVSLITVSSFFCKSHFLGFHVLFQ